MHPERRAMLAIGAMTLVGAVLRLSALGQESFWSDEYYSWLSASAPTVGETFEHMARWDPHPPLFFLVLHAWIRAGFESDAMLRLPGALMSAAGIPFFAMAALRMFPGRMKVALLAASLFAISPFQIWYAQEMRPYGMLSAWEAIALWGVVALLAEGDAKRSLLAVRASAAAVGLLGGAATHFHGWFVGFAIGMPLLVAAIRRRSLRLPAMLALGVPAAGVLAFLPRVVGLVREGTKIDWLPPLAFGHVDDIVNAQAIGPLFTPLPMQGWWAAFFVACALFAAGACSVARTRGALAACVAWGIAGTVAIPVVVSLALRPVMFMGQRYEIIAQPFAILLLAASVDLPRGWMKRTASCLLAAVVLVQCWWLADYHRERQKHPWDIVAREIGKRAPAGVPVRVLPSRLAGLLARYSDDPSRIEGIERAQVAVAATGAPVAFASLADLGSELAGAGIGPERLSIGLVEASRPGQAIYVFIVAGAPP